MENLRPADPQMIGRYRLLGRLGQGGMGEVFLGRSRGGRMVAVKVIRPELAADTVFRRRFAQEVRAVRLVGGFHTAEVVDADVDADPPWLVTAYIPGPSLATALMSDGPLPEHSVRVLGAGLAEALEAIHSAGLVHRDLKPANILLAADGPRVIDFGISRALEVTAFTRTGSAIGTPAFMAPEQITGDEITSAADIFALGAVLCASRGVLPYGEGADTAMLYRIVHQSPRLDGLPEDLRDIVAACMAREPAGRPSATDLLTELGRDMPETGWLPPAVTRLIAEAVTPDAITAMVSSPDVAAPSPGGTRKIDHEPVAPRRAAPTGPTGSASAEVAEPPGLLLRGAGLLGLVAVALWTMGWLRLDVHLAPAGSFALFVRDAPFVNWFMSFGVLEGTQAVALTSGELGENDLAMMLVALIHVPFFTLLPTSFGMLGDTRPATWAHWLVGALPVWMGCSAIVIVNEWAGTRSVTALWWEMGAYTCAVAAALLAAGAVVRKPTPAFGRVTFANVLVLLTAVAGAVAGAGFYGVLPKTMAILGTLLVLFVTFLAPPRARPAIVIGYVPATAWLVILHLLVAGSLPGDRPGPVALVVAAAVALITAVVLAFDVAGERAAPDRADLNR